MYTVLPYVLSKIIAELPLTALFPSISGVVMYKMTGLHPKRDRYASIGFFSLALNFQDKQRCRCGRHRFDGM